MPGYNLRGIERASEATLARWRADDYCQSPYQYDLANIVVDVRTGSQLRRLIAVEEERLHQYPEHNTAPLLQLDLDPLASERRRRS
eukprot:6192567-Alexandrium_andersonii.AAC.1